MNIQQAKQIKIDRLLNQLGHQAVKQSGDERWYLSPFREEKTPSFKTNATKNVWYDFGEAQGGDVIGLVKRLYRLPDISSTLKKMDELVDAPASSFHPQKEATPTQKGKEREKASIEVTDIGPIKHPALIRYLEQRGITLALASEYLHELHYRHGDKSYFALALTNDTGLQSGLGFEVRNEHFKGSIGPKDIRTLPGASNWISIYEGVFDYLSQVSLASDNKIDGTAIILNSAAMKQKALDKINSLAPDEVHLYLDNDATGKQLVSFFRDALPTTMNVSDKSGLYRGWKDLNEFHAAKSPMSRMLNEIRLQPVNRAIEKEGPSL